MFTAFGIMVQSVIPKIDALVCGIILLLQERGYKTLLWLLPVFILLQEGLGTRIFGSTIVWYVLIVCLFKIGERFFSAQTFLFVFFLAAAIGAGYYALNMLFAPLQNLELPPHEVLDASLLQAIFIPCSWLVAKYMRPKIDKEDESQGTSSM